MATTQDTFTQYAGIGYHGQLNTDYPSWIGSQHAEGGAIGFGVAVAIGTGDNQATLPASGAASADLIGVTVRTQAVENNIDGDSEYTEGRAMSVLEKGRMFVTVSDGAARGDAVYVVPLTGELVSTATDNVALTGARFLRTAAAGEVTEIEIK